MNELLHFIKDYFTLHITNEDYDHININIAIDNRHNLMVLTTITAIIFIILFFVSLRNSLVSNNHYVYGLFFVFALIIFAIARKSKNRPRLLLLAMYAFMGMLFIVGIILGTVNNPRDMAVSFMVLLFAVPFLFIDRPIRINTFCVIFAFIFAITTLHVKSSLLASSDILNVCVYETLSVLINAYMLKMKYQKYLYEYQIKKLGETDLLTGLMNRNSFEENYKAIKTRESEDLYCIYFDVNGLHELNNEQGHSAGDEMLKYVAVTIREEFGSWHSYRIGGDEFVSFLFAKDEAIIKGKLKELNDYLEKAGYHVSTGYSKLDKENPNYDELIRSAEKYMYANKRAYYTGSHNDRRAR